MATDQPLITRQRVFAAKVEGTTGVAETLSATEGVFNIFDRNLTPNIAMHERPGQSNLSPLTSVAGALGGTYSFDTELVGAGTSGSVADWVDTLLLACGWQNTAGTTYTPDTDGAVTLTMAAYEDGRRRLLVGAMGTFSLALRAGEPGRFSWEFSGKLGAHGDVELIAPAYPTTLPPIFSSATLTVGGTSVKVSEVTIALNNEVVMREDASDATGFHAAYVVGRRVTVSMDPEAVLHATKDWHAGWRANTEYALNCVVGSESGNTITITAPKMQITGNPVGDRNGIMTDQLEFQCNRSASAGDDELQIAFS